MKVLLDACITPLAQSQMEAAGHDVVWAGDWSEDPGDEAILALANSQERVLITLDKDFGELAILRGLPHKGIVRLVNFRAAQQGPLSIEILSRLGEDLTSGLIVTAEPGRVRIRRAGTP